MERLPAASLRKCSLLAVLESHGPSEDTVLPRLGLISLDPVANSNSMWMKQEIELMAQAERSSNDLGA